MKMIVTLMKMMIFVVMKMIMIMMITNFTQEILQGKLANKIYCKDIDN